MVRLHPEEQVHQADRKLAQLLPRRAVPFPSVRAVFKNPEEDLQEVFEFIGVQNQTVTINREYITGDDQQDI